MREPLLIGTHNPDKARELAELLDGLPWDVKTLADFPPVPVPREDGQSFEENAVAKATYYTHCLGVWSVADDSGLVVDALSGGPGVESAHYAGEGCSYADNNRKLLAALQRVCEQDRTARFVCCAALASPDGTVHVETGSVEGRIALDCRGRNGFGYDPLFVPEGYDQTFGELPPPVKRAISHRARAFRKLRAYLESLR